jgi:hypothetical protein
MDAKNEGASHRANGELAPGDDRLRGAIKSTDNPPTNRAQVLRRRSSARAHRARWKTLADRVARHRVLTARQPFASERRRPTLGGVENAQGPPQKRCGTSIEIAR